MAIDWDAYRKKAKQMDQEEAKARKADYEKRNAAKPKNVSSPTKNTTTAKTVSSPLKTTTVTGKKGLRDERDIAPVMKTFEPKKTAVTAPSASTVKRTVTGPVKKTDKKEEERTWFKKGAFSDGYQFGDVTKTLLGTAADVGENIGTGIIGMGERAVDALTMLGITMGNNQMSQLSNDELAFKALTGKSKQADKTVKKYDTWQNDAKKGATEFVKKDLYDEKAISKKILTAPFEKRTGINTEAASVLGEKSESLIQSVGQLLATAGLNMVGVPWFLTTGATSFGAETENALNQGATFEQASISAAISAGAEVLLEKASGGIKFGGKTLDDFIVKPFVDKIANKFVKKAVSLGVDALGEAGEEWWSENFSRIGQWLTYQDDKSLAEMLWSEEAMDAKIEAAIGGGLLGGFSNGIRTVANRNKIELTENEQAVVDKAVESRIAEAEKDGKKLSKKDKDKIYNETVKALDEGDIDTDIIESVLGGEKYESYKKLKDKSDTFRDKVKKANSQLQEKYDELQKEHDSLNSNNLEEASRQSDIKQEQAKIKEQFEKNEGLLKELDADTSLDELKAKLGENVSSLVKDSRLSESYNEKARRKEAFKADLTKYDEKQQKVIKKAVESGILNNTRKTHRFVDFIAKISADEGVPFDFTSNKKLKESGFAIEGKTVNGLVTKDGIQINVNSAKALNTVVGHEVMHIFEGTELYPEIQRIVKEVAVKKGEYQSRYDEITKLYEDIEDADIEKELTADLVGDYLFSDEDFIRRLSTENRSIFTKIRDEINYLCRIATAGSAEARKLEQAKKLFEKVYRESEAKTPESAKYSSPDADMSSSFAGETQEFAGETQEFAGETQETNSKLNNIGYNYDAKSETVSYSLSSLEDSFNYKTDENGILLNESDYLKARNEYVDALAKSIAAEKGKPTREEYKKADRYLDSLFLIHDMIAGDRDRLDYEAAVNRSAWVGNVEYGGSIDFSTLCAKRRLFTGTFDAIQNALPDTVLTDKDFLNIRNLLLEHGEESPCSMCYVEGSRAKHGIYVDKWLNEYLKTNPEWKPQIADFTSTTRLEQTRIQHPEAYEAYVKAMNKLSQRKPKEASVRTDYKGEILDAFKNGESVEQKNLNGGIRFNSFSDFEIIHALDCMQVLTDMSRVGLNGQAYTKVKEFAEAFGNTGLKINLSLVAKDVDANGKLVMDETNGMNYAEAIDIRNRYSDNVGTVIVVFNDAQLKAALSDSTIDFVLPFHRSQWRKSQYTLMGLPDVTRDYTNIQNDRHKNPKTGRPKKAPNGNIMPNEYWDFSLSGRENAQRYLDYINENSYIPKFDFLLDKVDGKWALPDGAVGDGYFKLLIDFKMYNNEGVGSPQKPVLPEFNMPYIQQMLDNYVGGHQAFPVANDVVDKFVEGKKSGKYSLSAERETPKKYGNYNVYGEDIMLEGKGKAVTEAPSAEITAPTAKKEITAPMRADVSKKFPMVDEDVPIRSDIVPSESNKTKERAEAETEEIIGESQLRTAEPKKNSIRAAWKSFLRNFVSKGSEVETYALKGRNRAVEDKYKVWKDRSEAKAQYFMENGDGTGKSLKEIYDTVTQSGLEKEFDLYMKHRLNVDRMKYEKPVFSYDISSEMSAAQVKKLETKHPEFMEWAKDVYAYNQNLLQMMVEKGLLLQETADMLAEQYPNYIPIERLVDKTYKMTGKKIGISAPIKEATGGNNVMETLLKTMAHRTVQVFKAIDKNDFGIALKNSTYNNTLVEEVMKEDSMDDLSFLKDENTVKIDEGGKGAMFTVYENGKKVTFNISNDMYEALQPTRESMMLTIAPLNKASSLHKKVLTEYNLFFTARNFPKDAQEVLINSQHPVSTYKNMPQALKEIISGEGDYITEYYENGGKSNTYFDRRTNKFEAEKSTFKKVIGFVPSGISKVNDVVEAVPRVAEYIASRKKGATIEAAMTDAARVTTDFSDGGDVAKFLNRNGATFLNASIQGASQQVRNIRQAKAEGFAGIMKLIGKYALSGLPVILFNALFWDDDEEYEGLSEYIKDSYYIIAKYGDGQFVRIPKGRTAAVIQKAVNEIYELMTSDGVEREDILEAGKEIGSAIISNIAPNNPIDNNILAPAIQAYTGTSWYGEDIVPTRLQDVPAKEQYDESVDTISKWLGEKTGISPYKINYIFNQYSGFVGDIVLPSFTPEAENGNKSFLGDITAPMKDQFTADSVLKNNAPTDFYTLQDKLKVNSNSKNATDEDKLKYKYISAVNSELSELYKVKREIQNSNLSDDTKFRQVREIQRQVNETAKKAIETYDKVDIQGKYAIVNDVHYRMDDEGKWQKITDEQLEKQNEATSILGITPSQYWSNKQEYDMKAFYPEKYAVLQQEGISVKEYKDKHEKSVFMYTDDFAWAAQNPEQYTFSKAVTDNVTDYRKITDKLYEIRADKNKYGKAISGSAKRKKKEYIWNLDLEWGAKYVLFKKEYPSDDTYNREIIDYVNKSGLTYDEKVTVFEELGFKVKK